MLRNEWRTRRGGGRESRLGNPSLEMELHHCVEPPKPASYVGINFITKRCVDTSSYTHARACAGFPVFFFLSRAQTRGSSRRRLFLRHSPRIRDIRDLTGMTVIEAAFALAIDEHALTHDSLNRYSCE